MADTRAPRPVYDAIADLYDVDMARNMAFDDVTFYEEVCRTTPGPVLELVHRFHLAALVHIAS